MIVKEGIELIKRFEGYHKQLADGSVKCYLDPVAIPTIGYGSTGRQVHLGAVWSADKAEARLKSDINKFCMQVLTLSPELANHPLKLAAITSFAYNCGVNAYKRSTLRKKIDVQDWDGAATQIKRWVYAGGKKFKGLELRRQAEATMLLVL